MWYIGMYGAMAMATVLLYYKPDTRCVGRVAIACNGSLTPYPFMQHTNMGPRRGEAPDGGARRGARPPLLPPQGRPLAPQDLVRVRPFPFSPPSSYSRSPSTRTMSDEDLTDLSSSDDEGISLSQSSRSRSSEDYKIRGALTLTENASQLQQVYVLYGSNTGNSESFAQRIASDAPAHGKISCLDWISRRMVC